MSEQTETPDTADDLDTFLAEQMKDPEFAAGYKAAQERHVEEQRNVIARAVADAGAPFVPLMVRYRAADAALAVVTEWRAKAPKRRAEGT